MVSIIPCVATLQAQRKAVRKLQNQFVKQLSSLEPHAGKVQGLSALHIHGGSAEVRREHLLTADVVAAALN